MLNINPFLSPISSIHFFTVNLQTVDSVYAELQRLNANSHNGVNFRDVMCHFVIGSDEANLLASGGGVVVRVLGDKEKKNTKKC